MALLRHSPTCNQHIKFFGSKLETKNRSCYTYHIATGKHRRNGRRRFNYELIIAFSVRIVKFIRRGGYFHGKIF